MDTAEELGYEVRVYMRVPDLGDGQDRLQIAEGHKGHRRNQSSHGKKRHSRSVSGENSTESEQGRNAGTVNDSSNFSKAFARSIGPPSASSLRAPHPATAPVNITSVSSAATASGMSASPPGGKIRYREQGVDELLQLKLHQAIAAVDEPPPGSTIVLATGDGNVGQFNEDGFLGPIRTALKKGWRVELYAWEEGLSKAWLRLREFGDGIWKERFEIVGLERFGSDLLIQS